MEIKITDLKTQISRYEAELVTLKARYKVAKSTKKINQQLAQIGSNSTTAMLEDMKKKVIEEEALASAYDEMVYLESDIDKEIDKALANDYTDDIKMALEELKPKLLTDKNYNKADD